MDSLSEPHRRLLPVSAVNYGNQKCRILKRLGAVISILVMVVSWVAMAELLQDLGREYKKPLFQTYLIHSFYAISYVIWQLWMIFPGNSPCNRIRDKFDINFKMFAVATAIIQAFGFFSGLLWYMSLPKTSIPANTAIFQSASAVVFILSVPLLGERVTVMKISSVILSIGGVSVVAFFSQSHDHQHHTTSNSSVYSDVDHSAGSGEEQSTPAGYVYVTLATILYALYETSYKKYCTIPDDPAVVQNSFRILGYVGIHTLLWMWPLLILAHFMGLERFVFPSLPVFKLLMLNVALDTIFNISIVVAIALSSPLFVTVGSILTVPTSVIVDWLVHRFFLPWQALLGIATILVGFTMIVISEYWEIRCHMQDQDDEVSINTKSKRKKKKCFYMI